MGILIGVLFGILAGATAKLVMPGPHAGGMAVAIPLGIVGALLGGLISTIFVGRPITGFDVGGLLLALTGTLALLFSYRCYAMRAIA